VGGGGGTMVLFVVIWEGEGHKERNPGNLRAQQSLLEGHKHTEEQSNGYLARIKMSGSTEKGAYKKPATDVLEKIRDPVNVEKKREG